MVASVCNHMPVSYGWLDGLSRLWRPELFVSRDVVNVIGWYGAWMGLGSYFPNCLFLGFSLS